MSRSKLTRNIALIVFLCFVLSTFVSLWSLHVMADKNMQALSKTLTARIYDSIIGQLSEPVIVSRTMANDSFIIDLLGTEEIFPGGMKANLSSVTIDYFTGDCFVFRV